MFWAAPDNTVGELFLGSAGAAVSAWSGSLDSGGNDVCVSCAAARAGWNGAISCLTFSVRCVQLREACSKASAEATLRGTPVACSYKFRFSDLKVNNMWYVVNTFRYVCQDQGLLDYCKQ